MSQKRVFVIAGEASGDVHGANLLRELQKKDSRVEIAFWGGDRMTEVAGKPFKHIRDLAFMGFVEVIANIRTIASNFKLCKEQISAFKPDVLVLIDYPGFNLRMAAWAKAEGIKVVYYISPQVWAWKENRVKKIKAFVDRLMVILPFEKDFFAKHGVKAEFVGHPLLDEIQLFKKQKAITEGEWHQELKDERPILLLLPGSRKQEVSVKLPIMLEAIKEAKDYQIIVAAAPALPVEFYQQITGDKAKIIHGKTYQLLAVAKGAIVTSGTATLETALFEVPQVVCYKANWLSYWIAKRLVNIKYISLVNLIMDREVVSELIQKDCNPKRIREEIKKVLPDGNHHEKLTLNYKKLKDVLGGQGASENAASILLEELYNNE